MAEAIQIEVATAAHYADLVEALARRSLAGELVEHEDRWIVEIRSRPEETEALLAETLNALVATGTSLRDDDPRAATVRLGERSYRVTTSA